MVGEPSRPPGDAVEVGLAKGATIGRYVVLGLLGRGGMGEVYAAYDPELDRKIAVKLLRARSGGESAADGKTRLLREAQAIARLSHPNVVVVYDVGTFRDSVFIAMEFVEGNTLGYWLQAAPRRWREVLDVYLAAGRGLAAAHAAGLVHRDFKPDNVMITKGGQVRVMDFGLARDQHTTDEPPAGKPAFEAAAKAIALGELSEGGIDPEATAKLGLGAASSVAVPTASGGYLRLKLTQTGAMLGTPAYMAPEQFAGTGGEARSDQFAFCVALYEGVYGRRPFAGDSALALMSNVAAGAVTDPPPEARVPAWIRKILLRGLATNPEARFPSMGELLAALGRDPAAHRQRWLAVAAAAALVAAGAAGAHRFSAGQHAMCAGGPSRAAGAWSPQRRASVERAFLATGSQSAARAFANVAALVDSYVARWTAMYHDTCEATQVRGEQSAEVLDLRMGCLGERLSSVRALTDVFLSADRSVIDNATSAANALPTLDRCADVPMLRAVIRPPDDPNVRAKVTAAREQVAKVKAFSDSGQCPQAAAAGRVALAAASSIGYLPLVAEAHLALGRLGEACTAPAAAIGELDEAVFAADASRHDQVSIEANLFLAMLYADRLHDAKMARSALRHSEAVLARFPNHPVLESWLADAEAQIAFDEGHLEEALQDAQKVLALRERSPGSSSFDLAVSCSNVALKFHALNRDAEAEPLIGRAVELLSRLFGNDGTMLATALMNQAEILTGLGKLAEADTALAEALKTFRRQQTTGFYEGYALLDLGKLELAEHHAAQAVATLERATTLIGDQDPLAAGEAGFALSRALWDASPRERARSVTLAEKVHTAIARDPAAARLRQEIDDWRSGHAPY